jgi:hypothetical protein
VSLWRTKAAAAEETQQLMDKLEEIVTPTPPEPPAWSLNVQCLNCAQDMKHDPAIVGRYICYGCGGVVKVVAERWSQKWGKGKQ